ncbi:hypothetical protein JTB14_037989 [Gonioctena quinquepunctata]|nr:hypothetical protein JTB14_037989 [Gonioctena quinquepunctata]
MKFNQQGYGTLMKQIYQHCKGLKKCLAQKGKKQVCTLMSTERCQHIICLLNGLCWIFYTSNLIIFTEINGVHSWGSNRECLNLDLNITEEDIYEASTRIEPGRTPGIDNVHGRILVHLLPNIIGLLKELFKSCIRLGLFPKEWKTGRLVTILKVPGGGDASGINSWRVLTLLSKLEKMFERYERHIQQYVVVKPFKVPTRSRIAKADSKFVEELQTERRMRYFNNCKTKIPTKGYPQGPALGPLLSNLTLEPLLREPDNVAITAYADDIAITMKANSRRELERLATKSLAILSDWAEQH